MADNIPLEIQFEIIQRIPDIKWVIRCRSVSKAWKSVIDSKDFVTAHTLCCTTHDQAHHHLLIRTEDYENYYKAYVDCKKAYEKDYIDYEDYNEAYEDYKYHEGYEEFLYIQVKYVSIVDDDTFPHQKLSVFVPDSVNKLSYDLLGTSHGLFCLYERDKNTAFIWNPTIRKTVVIPVPNVLCQRYYRTVVGFGLCPGNLDPKLVKITYVSDGRKLQDVNTRTQVEVFTLSSGGTWRSPLSSSNLPPKSFIFEDSPAVVDGFIYWVSGDRIHEGDVFRIHNLIMSFDLTSEEFTKVNLPDHLAHKKHADLSLSNLRGSLVVLELEFHRRIIHHVWMMIGHGCTRSFNRLYSIDAPDASIQETLGFRKSGAPIVAVEKESQDHGYEFGALAIYELESKSNTNIGIYGLHARSFVYSYMETLLLLDYRTS